MAKKTDLQNRRLTRSEKALLAVLLDPAYFKALNTERARAAGISDRRFYQMMADPWFREREREAFYDLLRTRLGPIVQAAAETAAQPGRDGHFDRKMVLEMAGLYLPKQEQRLTGGDGGAIKVVLNIPEAERRADD